MSNQKCYQKLINEWMMTDGLLWKNPNREGSGDVGHWNLPRSKRHRRGTNKLENPVSHI